MNWYRRLYQKFSMALPSVENEYPVGYRPNSQSESLIGIDEIDRRMSKDVANEFNSNRYYIGSGVYGIAYDMGNNMIEKITSDSTEYVQALRLLDMDLPDDYPVVNVHETEKVGNGLYRILTEKVIPLTNFEKVCYLRSRLWAKEIGYDLKDHSFIRNSIFEEISDMLNENILGVGIESRDQETINRVISAAFNLKFLMDKYSIDYVNPHMGNIGWRGDELVILDLGIN